MIRWTLVLGWLEHSVKDRFYSTQPIVWVALRGDTAVLAERDSKRNIGEELLQTVREIKAGKTGRVFQVEVTEATEARIKLGMSQPEFARMMGVSVRTLQDWHA